MATAKKSTKKPAAKTTVKSTKVTAKSATVKKAPVKKAPVKKKATAKKTTSKAASAASMKSFRVSRDEHSFTNFQITRQTVYWIILVAFIIFVQLWILKLQLEVAILIDAQQAQLVEMAE